MSSVHIIFKTGKTTVPVIASTVMMEVLKKACQYFKIDESRYQLMYGQTYINLSLPYRLSGIPNLSRVTIIEKKGTSISTVKIAIQMDDGKRFQSNFKTNSTLWDILLTFETEQNLSLTKRFNDCNQYIEPIVTILNREISTIESLQKSSLASLNVSEASLIKLNFKQTDRKNEEVLPIIVSYQAPTESPTTTATTTTKSPTTNTIVEANSSPKTNTTMEDIPPTTTETLIKSPNSDGSQNLPTVANTTIVSPPQPTNSEVTTPNMEIDSPLVKNAEKSPSTSSNIPLADNNHENTTTNTLNNNMDVQMSTPQPPKITTIDHKDRELLVYTPSNNQVDPKSIRHNEKMTEEDIKRLVESNKRIKKEKEEFDSVLRTKSMREREAYKKLKNFSTSIIRIVFPGQKILEMKFLIREKISNLIKYINEYILSQPNDSIYLYTTPPNKILDLNTTFLKEGLFPRAKIFLGITAGSTIVFSDQVNKLFEESLNNNNNNNNSTTSTISQEELDQQDEKERIEEEQMKIEEEKQLKLEDEQEKERQRALRSMFDNQKEGDVQKRQIPKWFTAGKK